MFKQLCVIKSFLLGQDLLLNSEILKSIVYIVHVLQKFLILNFGLKGRFEIVCSAF